MIFCPADLGFPLKEVQRAPSTGFLRTRHLKLPQRHRETLRCCFMNALCMLFSVRTEITTRQQRLTAIDLTQVAV